MNPIITEQMAERAAMTQNASDLFYLIGYGMIAVIAFWSIVRWHLAYRARQKRRDADLRREVDKYTDERWTRRDWERFADHHDLPESTRITLFAGME